MSEVWAGEVGPTRWLCPYCMWTAGLWSDEDAYNEHMKAHGVQQSTGAAIITRIDRENGVITLNIEHED